MLFEDTTDRGQLLGTQERGCRLLELAQGNSHARC